MNTAKFVTEVIVKDPDTKLPVSLAVYKHNESGGMFAVDASFIDQTFADDENPVLADPLNEGEQVELQEA
jgi:hypothetical protein